jgi:putative membrane protein
MRFTLVISLAIAVVAVVFALANNEDMAVNLIVVRTEGSKALILMVTFIMGVVVGLLSTLPARFRDRREVKRLKKQVERQSPPPFRDTPAGDAAAETPADAPSGSDAGASANDGGTRTASAAPPASSSGDGGG